MRIALLSTIDEVTSPGEVRPVYAQFAGSRVIERQLDLALELECETVACFVEMMGREVIELQHRAERAGAKFVPLRDPRPLAGLVTAADELLVFAAGVLPDERILLRHVGKPAVLVFPADPAVSRGYERIDAEFAWSGIMLARGAIVERLGELPPDADAPSALMRIALQTGARLLPLERRLLDEGEWHLRATQPELAEREARWIRGHAVPAPFRAPGLAVAERIGARLAQDILGRAGARIPWLAAGAAGLGAVVLATLGLPALGLGLAAAMTVAAAIGTVIERIARAGQVRARRSLPARVSAWLADPLLIGLIALSTPEDREWLRLFVPVVLFGFLRLGERFSAAEWRATYSDRILLALLLAPAAFFGWGQAAAGLLAIIVLVSLFFTGARRD